MNRRPIISLKKQARQALGPQQPALERFHRLMSLDAEYRSRGLGGIPRELGEAIFEHARLDGMRLMRPALEELMEAFEGCGAASVTPRARSAYFICNECVHNMDNTEKALEEKTGPVLKEAQ